LTLYKNKNNSIYPWSTNQKNIKNKYLFKKTFDKEKKNSLKY